MVQVYKKTHSYPEPPATSLLAFFLRYPNPFARHVLSVDVLDRTVDPVTGRIHTTRLILKRGILPKWATRWLPSSATSGGSGLDAWIYEESIVDPPGWGEGRTDLGAEGEDFGKQPRLRMQQGNLNHRKAMHVIEGGDLRAGPNGQVPPLSWRYSADEIQDNATSHDRRESYGLGKFEGNSETSRKGMSLILQLLRHRHPLPETAEFEFYPPPPPGFSESWTDMPEAASRQEPKEGSPKSFFLSPASLRAWARKRRED
ncbi:hypothetical protein I350_01630 [Cryptococcus amylolentus CBS 6273]|uniref:PRELI/MSF1 domain-containing protein n=1 Tax=Cryptococcus amylolentus CBS 6273 TaxID=1296118 RepID=A0A1E3KD51_9TREE|nr:hypothetical protein I350_01630 [Cryptococcus amylolentus CBS 6273]